MILRKDLLTIARAGLVDAEVLLAGKRYDGAIYVAGYAVEIALKARVCKALKWPGFPETHKEFENFVSFKTHKLDVLLHLSGQEESIKKNYLADWSVVVKWEPEVRYRSIGSASKAHAEEMVDSARTVLKVL